jgi:hypothetical protein
VGSLNITANATLQPDGSVIVARGSTANAKESNSISEAYTAVRRELREAKALVRGDGGLLRFAKPVRFSSLSYAASVVLGRQTNGASAWRTPHGEPIA